VDGLRVSSVDAGAYGSRHVVQASPENALSAWRSIVALMRSYLHGRSAQDLDRTDEGAPMTRRELVHHVVEANVVAAGIVTAGLGSPGCTFDWSWMLPFGPWLERMRYRDKPLEPAVRLLEALNEYVAAQLEPLHDGLERELFLVDQQGAAPRRTTVGEVLLQEAAHARVHLVRGSD
jgi:hypothetical protein